MELKHKWFQITAEGVNFVIIGVANITIFLLLLLDDKYCIHYSHTLWCKISHKSMEVILYYPVNCTLIHERELTNPKYQLWSHSIEYRGWKKNFLIHTWLILYHASELFKVNNLKLWLHYYAYVVLLRLTNELLDSTLFEGKQIHCSSLLVWVKQFLLLKTLHFTCFTPRVYRVRLQEALP